MKRWQKRVLIGCGGITGLSVLGLMISLYLFVGFMCGDMEYNRVKAPNRNLDAVLNCYSCGAMDSCQWMVHVVPRGQNKLESGNVVYSARHLNVLMAWDGDTLKIGCDAPPYYPPDFENKFEYDCRGFSQPECKSVAVKIDPKCTKELFPRTPAVP